MCFTPWKSKGTTVKSLKCSLWLGKFAGALLMEPFPFVVFFVSFLNVL